MITITEQYGYENPRPYTEDISCYRNTLGDQDYSRHFKGSKSDGLCYRLNFNNDSKAPDYLFETSYYIGTDWIVQNELPIHVHPKLNKNGKEINYLKMLFEALEHTENTKHLEHLYEIDFKKPMIKIDQSKDLLSPLLIVQFLQILKKIVHKGLKKSYYRVEENLNARVKGKILINKTVKINHKNSQMHRTFCNYEVYGYNSIENAILKKALIFVRGIFGTIKGINIQDLYTSFNYIFPAFSQVSKEVNIMGLKHFKPNPLFKEYEQAILLAKLILKKYGYIISNIKSDKVKTPPYWIDTSKLFELYVFGKLKAIFPLNGEVKFRQSIFYRELDYLLKSKDGQYKMVIDAKYKPRYAENLPAIEDLRQISGYARMRKVYKHLEANIDQNIDCLIIYPDQAISKPDFKNIDFKSEDHTIQKYINIFKVGISLPEIQL